MPTNPKVSSKDAKPFAIASPAAYTEEWRNSMGRLLTLSEDQKARIKKKLKKEIESWERDTAELHRKLREYNDLVEGIVEETSFPWAGASNIHVPVVGIYMKVFHSFQRRSILGAERIWYIDVDPVTTELSDELLERTPEIEEAINYKARTEWNIEEAISEACYTANRDGLGVLQVPYVEEYEHVKDFVIVADQHEFLAEFPDPESASMSPQEWDSLMRYVIQTASPEEPVEIPVEYDRVIYRGPKGEIVDLADFVIFPASAKSVHRADARGYGKRYRMRRAMVKQKAREGVWYAEAVHDFLSGQRTGQQPTSYTRAKDAAEGLTRSGSLDEYEFFELVYYCELDKGAGESKLLVTYSKEADQLMAASEYFYRVDYYAFFRKEKRPGRLIGTSIPGELADINLEINAQHNQRINSRTIAQVPMMKAKDDDKALKEFMDSEEGQHRPGLTYWLKDMNNLQQLPFSSPDLGQSIQEEDNDMKLASLLLGSEINLMSGRPADDDPDMPGNKTAMLINQSNLRLDDPLQELRAGVEQVGAICLSHLYQFGPPLIEYFKDTEAGQKEKKVIPKRILRKGLRLKMQGLTVVFNPDTELRRWLFYYMQLVKEPVIAQSMERRVEILRRALRAGRVPGRDRILPSPEEIKKQEIMMRAEVQKQMMMEQQAKQVQAVQAQRQAKVQQIRQLMAQRAMKEKVRGMQRERMMAGVQRAATLASLVPEGGETNGNQAIPAGAGTPTGE